MASPGHSNYSNTSTRNINSSDFSLPGSSQLLPLSLRMPQTNSLLLLPAKPYFSGLLDRASQPKFKHKLGYAMALSLTLPAAGISSGNYGWLWAFGWYWEMYVQLTLWRLTCKSYSEVVWMAADSSYLLLKLIQIFAQTLKISFVMGWVVINSGMAGWKCSCAPYEHWIKGMLERLSLKGSAEFDFFPVKMGMDWVLSWSVEF